MESKEILNLKGVKNKNHNLEVYWKEFRVYWAACTYFDEFRLYVELKNSQLNDLIAHAKIRKFSFILEGSKYQIITRVIQNYLKGQVQFFFEKRNHFRMNEPIFFSKH